MSFRPILLVIAALVLFLPGFATLPAQDRDEPRFAQASRQMLESGNYVDIRFGDEARNKKPVGIYWMQAAAVRAGEWIGVPDARATLWLYRVPSLAGALATVLLTYWAGCALLTPNGAMLAGLLTAATLLLGAEARLATTDAVVAATVAAAMGALARVYLRRRAALSTVAAFWLAIAIGVLVKGPITPMVPALAALVLAIRARSWRWLVALRPAWGVAVCLAVALPWFVLILLRTHGAFLSDSVGHDMMAKVAGGQELHGLPPGAYLLSFFLAGWPLAPFALLAVPSIWRARRSEEVVFLLAWLVPSWIVFEAVPTKLFHYVLPLYPALAILTVRGLRRFVDDSRRVSAAGAWMFTALAAMVPVLALVLTARFDGWLWHLGRWTAAAAVLATILALGAGWLARRSLADGDLGPAFGWGAAAAVPLLAFVFGALLTPGVAAPIALSARLVAAARAAAGPACGRLVYATAGDREPSLVFATDALLTMTDGAGAARFLGEGGCRAAFVDAEGAGAFMAALDPGAGVVLAGRVAGVRLNGGKSLDIGVYVRQ